MSKLGIEETMDVVKFVDYLADKMAEAMKDDGKIDTKEIISALIDNPDITFSTGWGIWDIPEELSDLDEAETMRLISATLPVIKKIVYLFLD